MSEKELNFPMVYQGDTAVGYGGNQEWFSHDWKKKAGCGCTSGTNLAAYYASSRPEMAGIYDGNLKRFDQAEYIKAMEEMYTYMRPGLMGYPYVKKFGRQFAKFCREHGFEAEARFCHGFHSREEAFDFVRESIDNGDPVALLILFHRAHALKEDKLALGDHNRLPSGGRQSRRARGHSLKLRRTPERQRPPIIRNPPEQYDSDG